jgi:hypothetical protein
MSEGVEILVSADDQASKVLGKVTDNVDAKVKQIRSIGGKAKASTEFIGIVANSLGNTQFAQAAGGLGQLSEKIGAFSEVSKLGGAGALAFKAGLLGVAAVAGFKIGTMIGDWAFETERWTKQLAEANDLLKESAAQIAKTEGVKLGFRVEKAGLEGEVSQRKLLNELNEQAFAIEKQIADAKSQAKADTEGMVGFSRARVGTDKILAEMSETDLALLKEKLGVIKNERDALAAKLSPYAAELELLKQSVELKKKNNDYIKSLQQEVELLAASKEEHAAIEAMQKTGGDAMAAKKVELLLREKDALLAKAEKQKEIEADERKNTQDKIDAATRLANLKKSELAKLEEQRILLTEGKEAAHAFSLEQEGIDKALAKRIASEKAMLDKQGEKVIEQAPQQAVQGRLLTRGQGGDTAKQSLEVQKKMLGALEEVKKKLPLSTSTSSFEFEVIGRS